MTLDQKRPQAGTVFTKDKKETPSTSEPSSDDTEVLGDIDPVNIDKALEYGKKIKRLNEQLQKLRAYLQRNDSTKDALDAKTQQQALGFLQRRATDVLSKRPRWVIHRARIEKVRFSDSLPTFVIEGKNLSSSPSLLGKNPEINAIPDPEAIKALKGKLTDTLQDSLNDSEGIKKIGDALKGLF